MGKLSARKKRVKQRVKIGKVAPETAAHVESLDALVEALQLLIPLGLQAVTDELNPLAKQYLTVAISGFKHGSYVLPRSFPKFTFAAICMSILVLKLASVLLLSEAADL